jgi:hypothetical protein
VLRWLGIPTEAAAPQNSMTNSQEGGRPRGNLRFHFPLKDRTVLPVSVCASVRHVGWCAGALMAGKGS